MLLSCTITSPEIEEGSKLLEDGLWRLRVNVPGFGRNVDIYNNTAIVSANSDSVASIHIFKYDGNNNWDLITSFTENDVTPSYGDEISIGNNVIAVSDCNDNRIYTYIKTDTTWKNHSVIVPPNVNSYTYFGKSLDTYENYLVVGSETGPAVLYELISDSWIEQTSLNVGDQQENEYEIQVRLSENFLATCKGRDIYVYNRTGNILSNKTLIDSTQNTIHLSNYRICLNDSLLVVGDPEFKNEYCGITIYSYSDNIWSINSTIEKYIGRDEFINSIEIYSNYILFALSPYRFGSNTLIFYSLSDEALTSNDWVFSESISNSGFRNNFALSNEFAIISGYNYAYIYEYR